MTMTSIKKMMTSPMLRLKKPKERFVLSIASVPSMMAITAMKRPTGIKITVKMHKPAIIAAMINVPSFPIM